MLKVKFISVMVFCLLVSSFAFVEKDAVKPNPAEYQDDIATLVATYLSYYHYEGYPLDDRISQRVLKDYLASLDYNRVFFLDSDIKEFQLFADKLDDDLLAKPANLEKPYLIFNRYKKRVNERIDVIMTLLDGKFDFTKDEYYPYDRSELPWAKSKADLDDIWRRRIKEELVRFKLRDKPDDESIKLLKKRYERLQRNINDYEDADIVEGFLSSLAESYDPHSAYLKPTTKENFDIQMGHSLEGIGATLRQEGEYTIVVEVIKGGPASRSKLIKANDKIIGVAQGNGEMEDVVDMRLDKVVKQIRGPKGTKIRLAIIPADAADQAETVEVTLVRDRVEITSRDARLEVKELKSPSGELHRFGVIEVPSFYLDSNAKYRGKPDYKSTTRDVRELLKKMEGENVEGLIIDLRQNGGGSLDEAIQLTGLFIKDGPVVQIKDYQTKVEVENDPDPSQVYNGPLVVLTSIFSASASEIFASAIQDYERGIVVGGTSTHGKGTVQNVVSLERPLAKMVGAQFQENMAGALKFTTHKFYRVSGGSTQFKGVESDVILPSPYDGLDVTEESLDYALPWDEIQPARYRSFHMVDKALDLLKTNSAKRVAQNPEFGYVKEDVAYRESLRKANKISLNLEKRKKEKEELDALEKKRNEARKTRTSVVLNTKKFYEEEEDTKVADADDDEAAKDKDKDKVEIPDYILEEALLVLQDYIGVEKLWVADTAESKTKSL